MLPKKIPDAIDVFVGGRIRMRRMMLKISQTRLADELGITFQQVQKYEKGTNRVGASRLQKIATVLGVPPSFFFNQENEERTSTAGLGDSLAVDDISQFLQSREGVTLNQSFLKISDPKVRQKIVALVKEIAQMDDPVLMTNADHSATEATVNS
ncbi:MAG: helix-turn-helix transcriptional regulator [Alphaproteobacteria bacterium]|nr:helix-turn-helix transcriptional regulator [Alphaproteobacteria bacterium]MBU1551587.1 helix-turn-helix transcriptional regulator [Alphaproteobacteria bacterium]MBU2337322.1 helix-turn-helix transcriptional regulator [Alphaproteobacteria bacterium]MBU2388065.1 helix-turn-helix transcriptional regulator [Alphaproteobacteria bacterium]|tara:strand:+ start:134 stop:595 length:462 start_codon:yes stop_codon:yes gene_type:complete